MNPHPSVSVNAISFKKQRAFFVEIPQMTPSMRKEYGLEVPDQAALTRGKFSVSLQNCHPLMGRE